MRCQPMERASMGHYHCPLSPGSISRPSCLVNHISIYLSDMGGSTCKNNDYYLGHVKPLYDDDDDDRYRQCVVFAVVSERREL